MDNIREPKQKRSIEKKKMIIEAGLKLFTEKGYYKTNTAEIAKEAGVSTGIVYSYFKDKKDIFMYAMSLYLDQMYNPMMKKLETIEYSLHLKTLLSDIIQITIESHFIRKEIHEEMMAMAHLDEDISNCFYNLYDQMVDFWIDFLKKNKITPTNVHEKLHISLNLIENLCHEYVYRKQNTIDYEIMKNEIINIIINLLST